MTIPLKTAADSLKIEPEQLHDLIRRGLFGFDRNPKIVCPWDLIPITDVEMQYMRVCHGLH